MPRTFPIARISSQVGLDTSNHHAFGIKCCGLSGVVVPVFVSVIGTSLCLPFLVLRSAARSVNEAGRLGAVKSGNI